jgi:hypothetical protein
LKWLTEPTLGKNRMVRALSSNAVLAAYQILQQFRGVGAREFEMVERAVGERKRLLTKPR